MLHQIEIVLERMSYFQRILEGDKYVTASLVPIAVYMIRQSYSEAIDREHTDPAVKKLAETLRDDFDERYVPACKDTGKVKYYPEDETGKYNRYLGVHQYYFFAAMLDPRTAPMLRDMIMTEADYESLKNDVVTAMVEKAKFTNRNKATARVAHPAPETVDLTSNETEQPVVTFASQVKRAKKMDQMFGDLRTKRTTSSQQPVHDDNEIRKICEAELAQYLLDVEEYNVCLLRDADDNFTCPLKWWKVNFGKYPFVANAARKYLPITATSAPSERVWSRAARILTLKRARLNEDLVERMMVIKENVRFLRKHCRSMLRKETKDQHLHCLIDLQVQFLPDLGDVEDDDIDVGQNDGTLDF